MYVEVYDCTEPSHVPASHPVAALQGHRILVYGVDESSQSVSLAAAPTRVELCLLVLQNSKQAII